MKFLDKKTPQVEFDNMHTLIVKGMSINQEEPVQVYGFGAIAANDKVANNFYIVRFTSVPYTLQ